MQRNHTLFSNDVLYSASECESRLFNHFASPKGLCLNSQIRALLNAACKPLRVGYHELDLSVLLSSMACSLKFCVRVCFCFSSEDFRAVILPWHPKVFDFAGSAPIHKSNLARECKGCNGRSDQDSIRDQKSHKRKPDETGKQRNSRRKSQLCNLQS